MLFIKRSIFFVNSGVLMTRFTFDPDYTGKQNRKRQPKNRFVFRYHRVIHPVIQDQICNAKKILPKFTILARCF